MIKRVRRVVTGQTSDQAGLVTHVEEVKPIELGNDMLAHDVWSWHEIPTLPYCNQEPYEGRDPDQASHGHSGAGHVNVVILPPESETELYSTDDMQIAFILCGEAVLVEADGTEVTCGAGDVVIQNGTLRAWHNRRPEPCTVGYVALYAHRTEPLAQTA